MEKERGEKIIDYCFIQQYHKKPFLASLNIYKSWRGESYKY